MNNLTIKVDVPNKGTLEMNYSIDDLQLRLRTGTLVQISITNPVRPEVKFTMPSDDFIVLIAQFLMKLQQG